MNFAGALITVAVAYYCGLSLARYSGEGLKTVDSLISFFGFMRRRIVSGLMPINQVITEFSDKHLEKIGFLPVLRAQNANFSVLWEGAFGLLELNKELYSELLRFGRDLGKLPFDEQIISLDQCIELLEGERARIYKELPQKQKTQKTTCLLCGLLTAIILL